MSGFGGLITTIIGAIIGAVLNEMYKRHRDAVAASAAIAGELASYRGAFESLKVSLPVLIGRAEKGEPLNIPEQAPAKDTAYDAYVDKIGLLGPYLAEDIARVYGYIRGFRSALIPISGEKGAAAPEYMEASLRVADMFAQGAFKDSDSLVPALRKRARQTFIGHIGAMFPASWKFWTH